MAIENTEGTERGDDPFEGFEEIAPFIEQASPGREREMGEARR